MIMFASEGVAYMDRPRTSIDDSVPTGPELWPILLIHRVAESWVRFSVKNPDGGLKPLTHLRVDSLQRLFPEWRERLMNDSYYSLNAFHHAGTAKLKYLSCLNACYCDLDYYKAGLSRPLAYALMMQAQEEGIIPVASLMVDSGRGFWLIYVLVDEGGGAGPVRYHPRDPEPLRRYRLVQESLSARIAAFEDRLHPDPQARDASRVTRVPGSVNTKTGTTVTYWGATIGTTGLGISYTLPDLMASLDIGDTLSVPESPKPKMLEAQAIITQRLEARPLQVTLDGVPVPFLRPPKKGTHPGRARGLKSMYKGRLADLERLMQMRGSFVEGMRNRAALILAVTLRGVGNDEGTVLRHLTQMGKACTPELGDAEIEWAVYSSRTVYPFSDARIIADLGITPDELAQMHHIIPGRVPRKAGRPPGEKPFERRRAEAYVVLREKGWLTSRALAAELTKRGYPTTHATALKDAAALLKEHPELAPEEGVHGRARLPMYNP